MSISNHLSDAFAAGSYLKDGPPKSDSPSTPPNPMTDPAAMDGMMSGMKTQMVMMVPQMIIMGWINFFFQGFVLSASFGFIKNLSVRHRLTEIKQLNFLSLSPWASNPCFNAELRPQIWMFDGFHHCPGISSTSLA